MIAPRYVLSSCARTTIAASSQQQLEYALEGSIFIAGAVVQWLRDNLRLVWNSSDIETLAASVPDSGGVVFVPAFAGLGAPHWDPHASGLIIGIHRGTSAGHIARAALEAGGGAPAVLNAANEVAVAAFLDRRIGFLDIATIVEGTLAALQQLKTAQQVAELRGKDVEQMVGKRLAAAYGSSPRSGDGSSSRPAAVPAPEERGGSAGAGSGGSRGADAGTDGKGNPLGARAL